MHESKKSDLAVVAVKPTNKAGGITAAEPVEPRAGTEGNVGQQSTHRTQIRARVGLRSASTSNVGQAFPIHDSIFLVTDHDDTVVRVQVNSAKIHLSLLRVKAGSHLNFSPAASTRRGGPSDDYHSTLREWRCSAPEVFGNLVDANLRARRVLFTARSAGDAY